MINPYLVLLAAISPTIIVEIGLAQKTGLPLGRKIDSAPASRHNLHKIVKK
jgi:hypothetical protein